MYKLPRIFQVSLAAFALPAIALAAATRGGALPPPLPLFPADNWWNADVSTAPIDPGSAGFISFVGPTRRMHPDFGGVASGVEIYGMPYVVVDGNQPKRAVTFQYWRESDGVDPLTGRGLPFYPIPDEAITEPHWIEGGYPGNAGASGDRHMLIVDRQNLHLYELFALRWNGTAWEAGSGAFFDLRTNGRRPEGWTSADASGMAILPGLVRYDETYGAEEIRHAFRVTVRATNGFVWPASHSAGSTASALPMGARLRLKASKDISGYPAPLQKIFRAMKKHGLIVADNGSDMFVSGVFDARWDNDILNPAFHSLTASDFEVVQRGWRPPTSASVDLRVRQLESADPGDVGLPLRYTVTVTNADTATRATGVTLTDTLPSSFAFVSASAGCAHAAGRVTCAVGDLLPLASAAVVITVRPGLAGSFQNRAVATSLQPERTPADNTSVEATTIRAPPTASITDVSVTEGNAGTTPAVFTVRLSAVSPVLVEIDFQTAVLTAATDDFVAASGTLVFAAGTTQRTVSVAVRGDLRNEANEAFLVNLVAARGTILSDPQGTGTIVNDDPLPGLSVGDVTVTEGDAGTGTALFRIALSAPSGRSVTVGYATTAGTALATQDFVATAGTLVIPAGVASAQVGVPVVGDLLPEPTETFTFVLRTPTNATLADPSAVGTIVDNDAQPALAVADASVAEGHTGTRAAVFQVSLSVAAPAPMTVRYATSNGTAVAVQDYLATSGVLSLPAGARTGTISVLVVGDRVQELNEAFVLTLSLPTGARIADGLAQGVIVNDDGDGDSAVPIVSIPFTAARPGRYRLAADLKTAASAGTAITIAASDVTLDLDGRTLRGTGGPGTVAVGIASQGEVAITVQNGTVRGFFAGVHLVAPKAVPSRIVLRSLVAVGNTYAGLWVEGRGALLEKNRVRATGGTTALGPDAAAVGIAGMGEALRVLDNEVTDTNASGSGPALSLALQGIRNGRVERNTLRNTTLGDSIGLFVSDSSRTRVTGNTLEALAFGVVFTGASTGTCSSNGISGVATPTMGVSCLP